jgi:DNA-binding MarR family transcriptional regulator
MAGRDEAALRAWEGMSALVRGADRRREVSDALGLSFARVRALRRLAAEPATMRELADRLGADPPYVTLIVDDLEQRGLVRRTPHPSDRRAKVVTVTDAGRAVAAEARRILDAPLAALRALPADDLRALDRIVAALQPGGEEPPGE